MPEAATHPVWSEIDLDALRHNFNAVRARLTPGTRVIASIKADAYGHGVLPCARALLDAGADLLASGDFIEARALREAGVEAPILMFGGTLPDGMDELLRHDLTPTVYDLAGARAMSRAAREERSVFVKVDGGLGRLGVVCDEAAAFIEEVATLPRVSVTGVYTHVPFFDDAGRARSAAGLATFDALLAQLARRRITPLITQARASAAVLCGLRDTANAVCVGHLLYGLSPMAPGEADMEGFRPVLAAVRSRLIHVATHAPSRDVAIGGHYGIANAMVTGVVPLGLQQGMRPARGHTVAQALFRGHRVRVMSVSLEHSTLDLSEAASPTVGDEITFLGECEGDRIRLPELAAWQGCTPLEVAMNFSRRLEQRLIDTRAAQPEWGRPATDHAPA